jgi:serine/threonine protein kinase
LVFKTDSSSYIAKVADFGYSHQCTNDNDLVRMPASKPWNAPEWHYRAFKPSDAVKMDVYSFGMTCLWILFREDERYPSWNSLEELKSKDTLRVLAGQFIALTGLHDDRKCDLDRVFNLTLVHDPKKRSEGFKQLLQLLSHDR